MKNTFLKTIGGTALAILTFVAFAQVPIKAQEIGESSEAQIQQDLSKSRNPARAIEGVWNHVNTRRNCTTGAAIQTFDVIHTYMRGGTLLDYGVGGAPLPRSEGQGIWEHESRLEYTTAFQFFRFNPDGTYAGKQVVREQIQLSNDGNSYTASATAQVLDVNGNVLANNCATGTATRFK